jgi:hypothetical protein
MAVSPRAHANTVAAIAIVATAVSLWKLHDSGAPPAIALQATTPVVQPRIEPRDRRAAPPANVSRRTQSASPTASTAKAETTRDAVAIALRAPSASDSDRRNAILQALADSGRADPSRAAAITARATRWHEALDPDIAGAIQLGAARCYRGGCALEIAFATDDAYETAREHLRRAPADADDGGRLQTPATPRGDGWLVADWIALDTE